MTSRGLNWRSSGQSWRVRNRQPFASPWIPQPESCCWYDHEIPKTRETGGETTCHVSALSAHRTVSQVPEEVSHPCSPANVPCFLRFVVQKRCWLSGNGRDRHSVAAFRREYALPHPRRAGDCAPYLPKAVVWPFHSIASRCARRRAARNATALPQTNAGAC